MDDWLKEQRALNEAKNKISCTLNFIGYFKSTEEIPESHGVYAAFAQDETGTSKLIYI